LGGMSFMGMGLGEGFLLAMCEPWNKKARARRAKSSGGRLHEDAWGSVRL
jgi:hypothetical protein